MPAKQLRHIQIQANYMEINRMNIIIRKLLAVLFVGSIGLAGLTACDNEGPAEELGEKVDEATQDVKRGIDDATD